MVRLAKQKKGEKREQHERFLNLFMFSENVLEATKQMYVEERIFFRQTLLLFAEA
jgi:hypothetical protein